MKIGDKVYFGPYGDYDDMTPHEIVGINHSDALDCNVYTIKNLVSGHQFNAYPDEIEKIGEIH